MRKLNASLAEKDEEIQSLKLKDEKKEELMESLKNQVANMSAKVKDVEEFKTDIQNNKEEIKFNKAFILSNIERIALNKEKFDTNTADILNKITNDEAKIKANTKGILINEDAINEQTGNITMNQANIENIDEKLQNITGMFCHSDNVYTHIIL